MRWAEAWHNNGMRPGRGRQKTGEELACLLLLVEGGGKPRWQEQAHGCALRHGGPTLARENQAGRGGAWAAAVPLACGRPGPAMCPRLAGPSGRRRASGRQKRLLRAWLHAAGGGASGTGAPSFIKSCTRAVIFDVCTDLSHESCKSAAFSPILPFFGQSSAKFLHVCRIGFPP